MEDLYALAISEKDANQRAENWLSSIDPHAMVGSRHHIVPRFHLERFADSRGQLAVRNRTTGVTTRRAIRDLAVKDFYTTASEDGELNSSFESLLNVIEGAAAEAIRSHLDLEAFAHPREFRDDERLKLDTYAAAQAVRGMRVRRQHELVTDYGVKLMNQGILSQRDLRDLRFIPHQNDHIKMFKDLSEGAFVRLADREARVVRLDAPLFLICDEPVVLLGPDSAPAQGLDPQAHAKGTSSEFVHLSRPGARRGMDDCEEVVLPLSPRAALVYGPRGSRGRRPAMPMRFHGSDALDVAEEINGLLINSAVEWVASHPEHPTFVDMPFPRPVPIIHIEDGGSPISDQTNADSRRRPHRLSRS
ncbi:DUF4238 domain-containing protein [Diaminobutyricibacter tongyongensis]|uniref:DUF4238 domain-containing protein n=1 Tax=Leifsonia tongyongensis TaxID=1268043 RepID=A0A6L9XW91_9MICO|nr:DUF4238 domain-containing protein [Diaminobutyricibacter tongyongensis]NEN05314.1 DUF4238 domain-containing protein [Diaminobutyricibacter tongyongensis]